MHGEWVHLLCAIWVPETRVANDVFMEPVTGVDRISKQRWKLVRPQFCLDVIEFSTISSYQEMFRLRDTGRCMHPMHKVIVFYRLSRDLCPQGEAIDANEVITRL